MVDYARQNSQVTLQNASFRRYSYGQQTNPPYQQPSPYQPPAAYYQQTAARQPQVGGGGPDIAGTIDTARQISRIAQKNGTVAKYAGRYAVGGFLQGAAGVVGVYAGIKTFGAQLPDGKLGTFMGIGGAAAGSFGMVGGLAMTANAIPGIAASLGASTFAATAAGHAVAKIAAIAGGPWGLAIAGVATAVSCLVGWMKKRNFNKEFDTDLIELLNGTRGAGTTKKLPAEAVQQIQNAIKASLTPTPQELMAMGLNPNMSVPLNNIQEAKQWVIERSKADPARAQLYAGLISSKIRALYYGVNHDGSLASPTGKKEEKKVQGLTDLFKRDQSKTSQAGYLEQGLSQMQAEAFAAASSARANTTTLGRTYMPRIGGYY